MELFLRRFVPLVCILVLIGAGETRAQSGEEPPPFEGATEVVASPAALSGESPTAWIGPAPPVFPEVVRRDEEGRAAILAVRITQPLRIDGALDEAIYRVVTPISGFIQMEPSTGEPATERTDV